MTECTCNLCCRARKCPQFGNAPHVHGDHPESLRQSRNYGSAPCPDGGYLETREYGSKHCRTCGFAGTPCARGQICTIAHPGMVSR